MILLERDDDVTQGATKGNSGIIHAGYDDKPNTNRSKFCWTGNQMFPQLDKELKFGYLKNGSLVVARNEEDVQHLKQLYERGQKNGIQRLRIIEKEELHAMEPYLANDCIAALYSPDAGTVTPYEFTIALAENAAINGVQIRTRHEVVNIDYIDKSEYHPYFDIDIKVWDYKSTSDANHVNIDNSARRIFTDPIDIIDLYEFKALLPSMISILAIFMTFEDEEMLKYKYPLIGFLSTLSVGLMVMIRNKLTAQQNKNKLFSQLSADEYAVNYKDIKPNKKVRARYIVNCGGLFADKIARMIGDKSFTIKPRLGEYLLLNKEQGHLAGCTLFPCPDTKIGTKGVLVQTTLWGNLILGPTARDVYKPQTQQDTAEDIMKFLLIKSKQLVPCIDASLVIHSFAGARAKSDRGDWIIEQTKVGDGKLQFYNVAGIDSPGLAGSPAIAQYVVNILLAKQGGLKLVDNKQFNPYRKPLIFPKYGWKGLKLKKMDEKAPLILSDDEKQLKTNVVCKCEKVTEYEILDAMRRYGVRVDTTQAIRRRTRAGMGHCQADINNCNCELYVAKMISMEKQKRLRDIGRRPWPATSLLNKRWLNDDDKEYLKKLVMVKSSKL